MCGGCPQLGVCRLDGKSAALEERLHQCAVSVYGYLKAAAAVRCVQRRQPLISDEAALQLLEHRIKRLHDPLSWAADVRKRIAAIERGEW